jgi:hypothetical protein
VLETSGMVAFDEGAGSAMVEADCFTVKACMLDCSRSAARAFGGLPRGFFGAACNVEGESLAMRKQKAKRCLWLLRSAASCISFWLEGGR